MGRRLDGFDPPTLRGLWHSAPYLHDGSALTLEIVLDNVDHVGELSLTDKEALVSYLMQIDERTVSIGELDSEGYEVSGK